MLSISDNGWGADPDERIRVTANWLAMEGPRPIFPGNLWLPLHYYLIALSIIISKTIPLGPRLLHLIFGILTIFPFYKLVRLVFNNRVALISTLIFIFYPIHILCSIVTLSEGPFLFFLITSIYYFFRYRQRKDFQSLSLSCISLILASMIRYEAWLFIIIIPLLLFMDRRFKEGFIFLYVASIFPFLWLMPRPITYMMYAISPSANGLSYQYGSLFHWLNLTIEYFSLPLVIFLILGFFRSIRDRDKLRLLIMPLALLLFFTYGVTRGVLTYTVLKNIEFSLSFSILFIPFIVFGFDRLLNIRLLKILLIPIFLGFCIFYMTPRTLELIEGCRYTPYVKEVGDYLKHNIGKDTKVLLNNYEYQSNHIPIYIGEGIDRFSISGRGRDFGLWSSRSIMDYIISERPSYIVYSDEGELKILFNEEYLLNPDSGISLRVVFESGPHKIYDCNYSDS